MAITFRNWRVYSIAEPESRSRAFVERFFSLVDGERMPCTDYNDANLQNRYYDGYTCGVGILYRMLYMLVTNLFAYSFKGELIHAYINYPERSNDKKLSDSSGLLFPQRRDGMTPPDYTILGYSAFLRRGESCGKLKKAREEWRTHRICSCSCLRDTGTNHVKRTTVCGVRNSCFERSIRNTSTNVLIVVIEMYTLLCTLCRSLNLWTRIICLNHVRTVYADEYTYLQPWVKRLAKENDSVSMPVGSEHFFTQ